MLVEVAHKYCAKSTPQQTRSSHFEYKQRKRAISLNSVVQLILTSLRKKKKNYQLMYH